MEIAFVTVKVCHALTNPTGLVKVNTDWSDNLADSAAKALSDWKSANPDVEIDQVQLVSSHYTSGVLVINYIP